MRGLRFHFDSTNDDIDIVVIETFPGSRLTMYNEFSSRNEMLMSNLDTQLGLIQSQVADDADRLFE